ncbi:hypothetical protein F0562_002623 [Nyssa sinensis]|uniref:Kinesin motor domain-containing protein n=1 Tax=Nyssa sinensis TaxID=561372 RepID=A0A5J5C6Y1_9ASTE|nr:hypothetical protein F0562_002623 [Nyssa sinensis]
MGENFGRPRPVVALDSSGVLLKFAENRSKIYSFDRVFHPGSSQDEIFLEVEPVIKSALDGYNACIFAYGQTGTGKTFTMEGTPDCPGVVPRTIEAVFKQASDSNHTFLLGFSMLEIYLGHLKDLLVPHPHPAKPTDPMSPCLSIQTGPQGEIEIENLVTIQVNDFQQAIRLYRLGCRFRSTASTNSNKSSSRSHCMIRISMTCLDAAERRRVTNKMWMVDLGGSERVLKTKAWGRRLEEGKAINLSLSALGDVINALQRKRHHIPYRNSKLTQVLKDSLGEDSKTLMLVHASPQEEDLCETLCSLNFATRVRSIHLGHEESTEARVKKEVAMTNLQQTMKQIEDERYEVRREIKKLNDKLENLTRIAPSSSEQQGVSHPFIEVPQSNTEAVKKIGNVTATPLPRFMRATICSRQKSGIDHQTSEEKDPVPARRRKPSSHRAESVTFPIKNMSGYNSESSISRTSCLVGLKYSADNETEYSQDISECDIKMIVFPERDKSLRSSSHQSGHISHREGYGNRNTNKFNSPKFLKINNWLHLHKDASNASTCQSKQVIAIPTPKNKNMGNRQWVADNLHDEKRHDYESAKRKIKYDRIKELADVGVAGWFISERATDTTPTVSNDFVNENSISPFSTSESIIMTQVQGPVYDLSIKDNKRTSTPPDTRCSRLNHQKKDDNGANKRPMQVITCEAQCSEAFMLNNSWGCSFSSSDVTNSIVGPIEDFRVSISRSELKSKCQEGPIKMGKTSEDEDLHVSAQHSGAGITPRLYKLRSQRGLLMDKANQKEDLPMPFIEFLGNAQNKGICDLLKEKIQILCTSALLGLGAQSLDFGHDFFYALML